MAELVNHPAHYNSHPSGVEAIDIFRNWSSSPANAWKYMQRAPHKGTTALDLRKAAWYIRDMTDNGYRADPVDLAAKPMMTFLSFETDTFFAAFRDAMQAKTKAMLAFIADCLVARAEALESAPAKLD